MKNAFFNEYSTKQKLADFILKADQLSMGKQCFSFELAFARKQGSAHGVLFNSGGSANLALLQALKNLGRLASGDRVAFSALTWSTNVMPIIQMGMVPVPVDCMPETLNSMSEHLQLCIQKNSIKAFFITNALGFAGDLDKIRDICAHNKVILVEDNCEALGTQLLQGKTGTFGVAASFSFFVAHHLSTIEGGMLCSDDDELAEMLRIVRANGWDRNLEAAQQVRWRKQHNINSEFQAKYTFYDLGYSLRPTEITGFLGLIQLEALDENLSRRIRSYLKIEEAVGLNDDLLQLRREHLCVLPAFAMPIICKTSELKEKYQKQFSGAGIEIRPLIAGNMLKQPFYEKYCDTSFALPGTDFLHANGFYCGNYPELTHLELEQITSCLYKY